MAQVLSVLVSAFVSGALARFAVPGPDPMPAWLTVLIGLVGSIGAALVVAAVGADPEWTGIGGFLASIVLVLAYRRFIQHRPIWGPEAYRFPAKGIGVPQYRERLEKAGIDPDTIGSPFAVPQPLGAATDPEAAAPATADADHPTENPAHYLGLLEELHDHGVLRDDEYEAARRRLLESLRA